MNAASSVAACQSATVRFSSMITTMWEYGDVLGATVPHGPLPPPPPPAGVVTDAPADWLEVFPAASKASTV